MNQHVVNSNKGYIRDEVELIETSGEMPEVSYYESISYLTQKEEGPQLTLTPSDIKDLEHAVCKRYNNIILRDLDYANRGNDIFRGMKRAIINYARMKKYQNAKKKSSAGWREDIGHALSDYIRREASDISKGRRYTTINCIRKDLEQFAKELGADIDAECINLAYEQIPLTFDEVYRTTLLAERDDYPFKRLEDKGDCLEIQILNEKQQVPVSLKLVCEAGEKERKVMRSKAKAIYQSIRKKELK